MHDIRWIRDNPDAFDAGLKKRGLEPSADRLTAMDAERRSVLTELQEMQNRRNTASKAIGKAKASGDEAGAQTLIDEVAELKSGIQQGEERARALEAELEKALAEIPNLPAEDVPVGADEAANVERHRHGAQRNFGFAPKQHFEIGEALGLMDFETAAKLSGARFVVLKGALARLERAIAQFMLDLQTEENGYTEVNPPLLVRDEVMFGTGQLPKFEEDQFAASRKISIYEIMGDVFSWIRKKQIDFPISERKEFLAGNIVDGGAIERAANEIENSEADEGHRNYWLVPTAEVPLTNLVRESILDEAELPLRYTAFTPCFRAEAGAAGRDTRGMIRQHQFEKVELVSITTPEASDAELERMLACAEEVLKRLELPYRVMTLSSGDMGFSAARTYDIEVWLPGQDAYREISSCSVCGDFQARRMNARYRPRGDEKGTRFVHTLNGSGLAVGRTLVAILENHQNDDGTVAVPEALRPYMGGIERITPARKTET